MSQQEFDNFKLRIKDRIDRNLDESTSNLLRDITHQNLNKSLCYKESNRQIAEIIEI